MFTPRWHPVAIGTVIFLPNHLETLYPTLQLSKLRLPVELWLALGHLSLWAGLCWSQRGGKVGGKSSSPRQEGVTELGGGRDRGLIYLPTPCHAETLPGQGQVLPVSHRVSAEDHVSLSLEEGEGWEAGVLGLNLRALIWSLLPCRSTTVDPREKLEVLEKTYGEIEATVSRVLGQEHKLPMDDLLPLLIYVVSRAR